MLDKPRLGFLDGLTPNQLQAANKDGPVLVLAGAGTGKTRTLTAAVARRIMVSGIDPSRILAVTFTNKAAKEMSDRIQATLGTMTVLRWVGTFHGLGARQLRTEPEVAGLRPGFDILDADDSRRMIKRCMKALNLAGAGDEPCAAGKDPLKAVVNAIAKFKDNLIAPSEAASSAEAMIAQSRRDDRPLDPHALRTAAAVYVDYQRRLCEKLYGPARTKPGPITEVACWAHTRRGFFDDWEQHKSPKAKQALDRIATIYAIEARAAFAPVAERVERRRELDPLLDDFFAWAHAAVAKLSAKANLAEAFRYALNRREALSRFVTDGLLEIDNNIAENAMRCVALGRKNYLFAGSNAGGERAASIYTLGRTAKLNNVNPESYLCSALTKIAEGHTINKIDTLLPWKVIPQE